MRDRITYKPGDIIGNCVFVKDVYTDGIAREAMFKCGECNTIFQCKIHNIKNGNTKSCGCFRKQSLKTHGLSYKNEYKIWQNMKVRCYNKNSPAYKNWGGRGITVYNKWIDDFELFYNYITSLPGYNKSAKLSLDRIDNDGDYEPGNLRWADMHTQAVNKSMRADNSSGYTGVVKNNVGWMSRVNYRGVGVFVGNFRTPEQANAARLDYLIENELYEYIT